MPKVFISLITFNDNLSTSQCLESLEKLNKKGYDLYVVVIDNGSREKYETNKEYKNFDLKILYSGKNLGFSGGQNFGIKYALEQSADYIVVLNNDTIADENLIIELLNSFKDSVGAVSPKIYFAKGYEFHKDRYETEDLGKVFWYAGGVIDWKNVIGKHRGVDEVDRGQFDKREETEVTTGCCMMVSREVFEKVGMFDDKFFLYYEDADLSMRMQKHGFKIIYESKAILWHKNAASTGSGSELQDYYITRNRLVFGSRYASFRVKIALLRQSLKILLSGRKWQKTGVRDFYLNKLGSGSYINT